LRDVVRPAVTSDAALADLRLVSALLRDVDWNEAGFRLVAENEHLLHVLHRCSAWIDGHPQPEGVAAEAITVRGAMAGDHTPSTFAEANDVNRARREAITSFLRAAEAAGVKLADIADIRDALRRTPV
jgi:hypothetical protein